MILVKNLKFEPFVLYKVFGDVLVRKPAFLDNKNKDLKKRQNCNFCKRNSP